MLVKELIGRLPLGERSDGSGSAEIIKSAGGALLTADANLITEYEDAGGGVVYFGEALPGTSTSAGAWRIRRITTVGGSISTKFAGTGVFDQVWNNRASLSYS
jgi:hypothetical protein